MSGRSGWSRLALFYQQPDTEADEASEDGADNHDDSKRTADASAVLAERHEPDREEIRLDHRGDHRHYGARDNADQDINRFDEHPTKLRFEATHFFFAMRVIRVRADDPQRFAQAAAAVARSLRPGDVVALSGALGAGKTAFVAAAVRALHGSDQATSPTFTFWHHYEGTPPIEHIDLYRVAGPADLATLGLEEAFSGESVVFVEWPERAPSLVPPDALRVTIAGSGDEPREIMITHP
jgi:tRNA threonylcarbamoyladenosine biosynthesis protein TsaE